MYSEKFGIMLEVIGRPDGGKWTGAKMDRATGGKVGPSYFTSLRDGHIEIPRADKIEAIARVMGFPPELWFKDLSWWRRVHEQWERGESVHKKLRGDRELADDSRLSTLLGRLFEVKTNGESGEPFTNAEVARSSEGILSEEEVAALREGRLKEPTWRQILAVCDVFGVGPSYFAQEPGLSWVPSRGVLDALDDQESYTTFQNSLKLPKEKRSMLKSLSEYLRREQADEK